LAKIKKRREQYSDAIKDFILGCLTWYYWIFVKYFC